MHWYGGTADCDYDKKPLLQIRTLRLCYNSYMLAIDLNSKMIVELPTAKRV